MRILGFSRKDWMNYLTGKPKLEEVEFTTFRFTGECNCDIIQVRGDSREDYSYLQAMRGRF